MTVDRPPPLPLQIPLEDRVTVLERSVRRWQVATGLFFVLFCLVVWYHATPKTNVLRAHRLEILNLDGDPVVVVGAQREPLAGAPGVGGGFIDVQNAHGQTVVRAADTESGGVLAVSGQTGRARAVVTVDSKDGGIIGTFDAEGKPRPIAPFPAPPAEPPELTSPGQ